MKISATIITLNEENNIKACIESVQKVCDEVIVIDSQSSDKTVEIAASLGAKIVIQKYLGDGAQKDFGVQFAINDWILSIDADERLDLDMIEEIKNIDFDVNSVDGYSFRRKSYIGNRWQRLWYPDNIVRLYNKNKCRYLHMKGHAYVDAKNIKRLKSHILHYSYKNLSDMAQKINKFTLRSALIMYEKKKKIYFFTPISKSVFSFIKKYILKGGFLMGVDGLTISIFSAFNTYLKYAMLLEMYENEKK